MPYAHPEALVSTEWLAAHLADPNVRVLDSSFKQPGITPTAREDYDAGHIPADLRDIIREILDWLDKYLGPVKTTG